MLAVASVSRRLCSVVVPASTPIFLPARAPNSPGPSPLTRRLAPSTNVAIEKSTCSRRDKVAEVGSQRRSAFPDWIEAIGGGDEDVVHLEIAEIEPGRQILRHRTAKVDHEARGFADRVGERKRRRVLAVGDPQRFVLLEPVDRSGAGGRGPA